MILALLRRLVFGCPHTFTYRDRIGGQLALVCHECEKVFPIRLHDDVKAQKLRRQILKSRKQAVQKPPADVLPMRRKSG